MFDVRPVNRDGSLDLARINSVKNVLELGKAGNRISDDVYEKEAYVYQLGKKFRSEFIPVFCQSDFISESKAEDFTEFGKKEIPDSKPDKIVFRESFSKRFFAAFKMRTPYSFASLSLVVLVSILAMNFAGKTLRIKDSVLNSGNHAYANLAEAKDEIMNKDFHKSSLKFNEAYNNFDEISRELDDLGGILIEISKYLPYFSKLSAGVHLAEVGKDVSSVGMLAGEVMDTLDGIKNPMNSDAEVSFLEIFQNTDKNSREILVLLERIQDNLSEVNADDIPEDQRIKFIEIKNKLPEAIKFIKAFIDNNQIFTDVLGGNGPRKYLFLFQNNNEMRATGGFIGSYGVLDIFDGRVRNFFIDGIYNPDGQLREKVVPPIPIQKISAAWSLHDSNWFPDFPTSAEKATWFYEKTGGPTVDGVIAMTPTVMQKLLEITGPIEMPEYGLSIDSNNFIEKVQYKVEVDYDKEINKPKQILSDLAPKILDRIFNEKKISDAMKTMDILMESLNEKQLLIYSRSYEIEKKISAEGWSGEVLQTDKDYLSVINTNINGYKTDGVIEEIIDHESEIQNDGSIIDTVTITRQHKGGDSEYDWWNKVNSNYMRVYVPKGSVILEASGQTREFNSPPLDYDALGFKRDPQVKSEEDEMKIDEESGTKIYQEFGKTVFANWVYVSPKETVVIKYKYVLPFRIDLESENKVNAYSLLAQKQSGSLGSKFSFSLRFPGNMNPLWRYPHDSLEDEREIRLKTDLKKDKFIGIAFSKND